LRSTDRLGGDYIIELFEKLPTISDKHLIEGEDWRAHYHVGAEFNKVCVYLLRQGNLWRNWRR